MTTLAANSTASAVVGDNGYVTIATNGGTASITATLPNGTTQVTSVGPQPERRRIGPFSEGATIVIANGIGELNYDVAQGDGGPAQAGTTRYGIGDLVEPFCIAHRGAGALMAPEGTREAYQLARTYPFNYVIDGGDWYDSADGGLFDCHNGSDLSQITNLSGALSAQTSTALRRCTVTAATWFKNGSADQTGLLGIDDFLSLVRGRCISPEAKTRKAAQLLARELSAAGMQARTLFNSFNDADFAWFVAEGFPFLARNVNTGSEHTVLADATQGPARCVQLKSLGVNYVILDEFDSNFAAAVAVCKAAGMKVGAYTSDSSGKNSVLAKQYHRTLLEAYGLNFYVSDDPLYFMGDTANYRRTSDVFALKAGTGHGHQNRYATRPPTVSTKRGTVTAGGTLDLTNEDTQNNWILAGNMCPLANAASSYTLALTVKLNTIPADLTRWVGVAFCCPDDRSYTDSGSTTNYVRNDGYQVWVTMSNGSVGTLNIARKTAGSGTNLGGTPIALSAAITAGSTITITIAVTPTTITASVSGAATGTTGAISDNNWRGGYFWFGHAAIASGTMSPQWGPIAVS